MGAKLGQNNIKGERTRLAILDAAEFVYAEGGYRASSLAAIAERAGITQSGLLHHFASKEELLVEVLSRHESDDGDREARTLRHGGLGVAEGFRRIAEESAQNRAAVRMFAVLVAEATDPEHPAHEYMRARYERQRNRLVGALAVGVQHGEIRPDVDLASLATLLIAAMDGLQLQWIYQPGVDMARSVDLLETVLRGALAAHPEGGDHPS